MLQPRLQRLLRPCRRYHLGPTRTKSRPSSRSLDKKRKAPDLDSVTPSANKKGAADPLMDNAAIGVGTASGDMHQKHISAASAPTLSLTIEAGATPKDTSHKIIPVATSADESQKYITVANPPVDDTTSQPTNNDGSMAAGATQADTTTNINAAVSPPTDGGAVMVAKSTKHIRAPSLPPGDEAMEALARPAARSTKINAAADDQSSKSTAAGRSLVVGVNNVSAANPSADGVAKLSAPMAKKLPVPIILANL
jgi:hypothetical protein